MFTEEMKKCDVFCHLWWADVVYYLHTLGWPRESLYTTPLEVLADFCSDRGRFDMESMLRVWQQSHHNTEIGCPVARNEELFQETLEFGNIYRSIVDARYAQWLNNSTNNP